MNQATQTHGETSMSKINLHGTTDAQVWAEEFMRYKEKNNWTLEDIDEGLMLSWFANCLCAQMDHDARNKSREPCVQTVGWAWAYACNLADKGINILDVPAPDMLAEADKAFAKDAENLA